MESGACEPFRSSRIARAAIAVVSLIVPTHLLAADAERGMELAETWCVSCHSIGTEEPRQEDAGPLFAELAKKDTDYLQEAINRPHDFMPDFPSLDDADKADLIAYIQTVE